MNYLDDQQVDQKSFSWRDLLGQDKWETNWAVVFGSLGVVGATNYSGRYRLVGKKCEIQVKFSAATSIASTAGTDYLTLPITMKGIAGMATMTNDTTNIAVGVCHMDATTSRCYLPSQTASGNVFTIAGWFEV